MDSILFDLLLQSLTSCYLSLQGMQTSSMWLQMQPFLCVRWMATSSRSEASGEQVGVDIEHVCHAWSMADCDASCQCSAEGRYLAATRELNQPPVIEHHKVTQAAQWRINSSGISNVQYNHKVRRRFQGGCCTGHYCCCQTHSTVLAAVQQLAPPTSNQTAPCHYVCCRNCCTLSMS